MVTLYLNGKYLAAITGKTQATDSLTRSFKAWEHVGKWGSEAALLH